MTITAHNSLCSTRAYHLRIDLARMPLLGNVACNLKKIPTLTQDQFRRCIETRGEECCRCTLIDRKRKRYDNAVDVVVHLHDRPILAPKVRHLRDLHTLIIPECRESSQHFPKVEVIIMECLTHKELKVISIFSQVLSATDTTLRTPNICFQLETKNKTMLWV